MVFLRLFVSNGTPVCSFHPQCMHGNRLVSLGFWWSGQDPGLQGSTLYQVCLIFCLENEVSFHDCTMSEQSAWLSQFPAIHCSPQHPLKLCCIVIVVVCMSSQLGTVSTSAHRPADAQLSCSLLFSLPAELQCGNLCHWAGCIPRHCFWWQSWLAI